MTDVRLLAPGDPVPWFIAPTSSNPDYHFATVSGRYIVMAFVSSSRSASGKACLEAIADKRNLFDDRHCAFFGVTGDPIDQTGHRVRDDIPGVRWFYDGAASIARNFGLVDAAGRRLDGWFLLDPMLRVMATAREPQRILDLLPGLPAMSQHAGCDLTAPVLVLGRVFEPELCKALIDHYLKRGGDESGFMIERAGKTVLASDYGSKRRSDCTIEDNELREACRTRIHRRVAPELAKCFQFQATRMERYIVACYRADEGGHFRPHRDNTTKGTAHRRFAVTVNLNADEYEGGGCRFPEFGSRVYKPPTGGALVFSCSLQHEALLVTKGVRYAFLPFLYDEAAARLRQKNNPYLDKSLELYRP